MARVLDEKGKLEPANGQDQMQQALQQHEAELAAIYEHAPVIMCLLDEDRRVVRLNQAAMEFTGHTQESGRGLRGGELLGCTNAKKHPEGFGASCENCKLRVAVLDTLHTGTTHRRIEAKLEITRNPKLQTVYVLASTARLDIAGQPRVLLCLEDISQNKEAEARSREQAALLDIVTDAILVAGLDGQVIYWNRAAERVYGWRADEACGQDLAIVLAPANLDSMELARRATLAQGTWDGQLQQKTREQRRLTVHSRWTLMRDAQGQPKSILVVSTDISEQDRLQKQLLRAQRLESIGTLASGIAHDLNNVLSPILMINHMLREQAQDASMTRMLDTVETSAKRGADILKQVLTFARGIEGERVVLQPKHLLREIHNLMRETFPRSIELELDYCAHPWTILGDPTQIQQVLVNLCVNARDAMPRGGSLSLCAENVELTPETARFHVKARPGRWVLFTIADTGVGIPAEILDQIFDPFFTTKPLGQGTGLGLATALGIIEKHGGFIHVTSKVGGGTTFQVYLPASQVDPTGNGQSTAISSPPAGDGELILLVEDEAAIRRVLEKILTSRGYRVVLAKDGMEAVIAYRAQWREIKAVVTDLMMPGMDGIALIKELKKDHPGLNVIGMTGLGEEAQCAQAVTVGLETILRKPFTPADLLGNLARMLGKAPGTNGTA